jgi:hypothetical protein
LRTPEGPRRRRSACCPATTGGACRVDIAATADAATSSVKPGQTVTATVYFDVPDDARVLEVEFTYIPPGMQVDTAVAWTAG